MDFVRVADWRRNVEGPVQGLVRRRVDERRKVVVVGFVIYIMNRVINRFVVDSVGFGAFW
jgi:hypothetical protein